MDVHIVDGFIRRFGGITFRVDDTRARWMRLAAVTLAAPVFILGNLVPYAIHTGSARIGEGRAVRGAWPMATGTAVVAPLALVSHHFMSREEIGSPLGRERLAHCVFRVAVVGSLVSTCEVNALGVREQYYASLALRRTV